MSGVTLRMKGHVSVGEYLAQVRNSQIHKNVEIAVQMEDCWKIR